MIIPTPNTPPSAPPKEQMGVATMNQQVTKHVADNFTWGDARAVAMIVRDGLLMIVKGFEKYFDIGKK
jgi:hypothetical protein